MLGRRLISTISHQPYPFSRIEEYAENGEALEVQLDGLDRARIDEVKTGVLNRFSAFIPFEKGKASCSLGEGDTPLLEADPSLKKDTGIENLWIKDETRNPTGSFKDRGSLLCLWMAEEMGESVLATVSTGNMGHSTAAYAARSGKRAIVFVPEFAPMEKIMPMAFYGGRVYRVQAPSYAEMKDRALKTASQCGIRLVTGNGPIRCEGYKFLSFELYEQFQGQIPDYIALPVSACGHVRGIFKGFRELMEAGFISRLPKMVVVQAAQNAPIVQAIQSESGEILPFPVRPTVAEAITSTNPPGGSEIVEKTKTYHWLAETATEAEIIDAHRKLARGGFFVEPSSATVLPALRKLSANGQIPRDARVVIVLTGSGMKDLSLLSQSARDIHTIGLEELEKVLTKNE
ncbi:MAG: threonine synthase [Thermotogota bacterium]|nr:threonine synthase [Thermotogota bacterium]